jgi:uroporphyrinogen decarboxylase
MLPDTRPQDPDALEDDPGRGQGQRGELAIIAGFLCPIGNINNKTTMVSGTPEDVRREALECLRIAAPGGGYVLATDHSLHDDIPLANIRAYIEVAKTHGSYPLKL